MCCETTSEKKRAGTLAALLGTILIRSCTRDGLTPQWLIWARYGINRHASYLARLQDVQVKVYASLLVKDTGMQVSGISEIPTGACAVYCMGPEPQRRNSVNKCKRQLISQSQARQKEHVAFS